MTKTQLEEILGHFLNAAPAIIICRSGAYAQPLLHGLWCQPRFAALRKRLAVNAATATATMMAEGAVVPQAGSTAHTTNPNAAHVSHSCVRAREDFAAYLGGVAAHGHADLHVELKEAKRQVANHGGYSTLTKALGIPRTAIVDAGGLGLLRITAEDRHWRTSGSCRKTRYFTPANAEDKNNRLALIVPVWDGLGGDLTDLLAVRLDHPAQFYVRNGYARCLGEWNAEVIRDETTLWELPGDVHPSLVLSPNPLAWLRGDCQGAVVLHVAWLSYVLEGIKAVVAHNERHAKALHKLLKWPGAPKIYLRENREAA